MALQDAPVPKDTTDIKFLLHSKYRLLDVNASTPNYSDVNVLAAASTYGMVILASPASASFQVVQLNDIVGRKGADRIPKRTIPLPAPPYLLALSCDHSMLAVCFSANNSSFISIYSVPSFLSNNVITISQNIRVSPENNVRVSQILWNPTIANTMAVCLDNGALCVYVLKDSSYEFFSIDKTENIKCASWSPKGKQIVVGCSGGKLQQYKPDLKLAKTIPCTVQLLQNPFAPIAIQWLSTFQFAVVFLEEKEEPCPALFIVNAQKNVPPTYINYYDICYSQSGPRKSQVFLQHILPWNLILVGSANSAEIAVLGTTESGETPTWIQYIMIDDARAELPLSANKEDTFPIGVALDTGTSRNLIIDEKQIPVMPMIHILSTHGLLLTFDLLNLQPNAPGICSPPQRVGDQSGLHLFNEQTEAIEFKSPPAVAKPPPTSSMFSSPSASNNMTFVIPPTGATSTPAKPLQSKPSNLFGSAITSNDAGSKPMTAFGGSATVSGFGSAEKSAETVSFVSSNVGGNKVGIKPFSTVVPNSGAATSNIVTAPSPLTTTTIQSSAATAFVPKSSVAVKPVEPTKPFLTVANQYVPQQQPTTRLNSKTGNKSDTEDNRIFKKMMEEEISSFDIILKQSINKSRSLNVQICSKEQCSDLLKRSGQLHEMCNQAIETTDSLRSDVHALRLTLYEALRMSAEAESKVEMINNPSFKGFEDSPLSNSQSNKRQLEMLQKQINEFETCFNSCNQEIDASWSSHLENIKEINRARMHVPTLENVYQTLHKQHAILLKEREKISKIKQKLGIGGCETSKARQISIKADSLKINTLVDSVLNLTIGDQLQSQQKALDPEKTECLRKILTNRKIWEVKPSRPERKGLNSEVVIEKKLALAKAVKAGKAKKAPQQTTTLPAAVSKPAAIQPVAVVSPKPPPVTVNVPAFVQAPLAINPIFKPTSTKPKEAIPTTVTTSNNKSDACPSLFAALTANKPSFGASATFGDPKPFDLSTSTSTTLSFDQAPSLAAPSKPLPAKPASSGSSLFESLTQTPTSKPLETTKPVSIFGSQSSTSAFSGGFSFGTNQNKSVTAIPDALKTTTTAPQIAKPIAEKADPIATVNVNQAQQPKPGFSFNQALDVAVKPVPSASGNPPAPAVTVATTKMNAASVFGQSFPSSLTVTISPTAVSSAPTIGLGQTPTAVQPTSKPATPAPVTSNSWFNLSSDKLGNSSPSASVPSVANSSTNITSTVQSSVTPQKSEAEAVKPVPTSSFGFSSGTSSIFGGTTAAVPASPPSAGATIATSSSSDVGSIFKDFNICKPTVRENAGQNLFSMSTFGSPAASSAPASIFGGSAAPASTASSSIFGSTVTTTSSATSIFSGFGISAPSASASPSTTNSTNVFGNVPKPEQSIFGASSMNTTPFGPSTASPASPFGSPPSSTGAPLFGAPLHNQINTSPSSIFGGGLQQSQPSSVFRGTGQSIFSSPKQEPTFGSGSPFSANAASGGSLFGSSTFGSPSNSQPTSGGSIFGGGFGQAATANTSVFSSASQNSTFGAQPQNNGSFGGGGFAAGGPSIAQTGFGSPTQSNNFSSQTTAFGSPSFGAPATFGSPRGGFGTFANNSFAAPATGTQGNSLFESLGSGGSAMTFGNLAQATTVQPPAAPKQSAFGGGGSFSTWR